MKLFAKFKKILPMQGNLLHHNAELTLFGNKRCFIWYHNIAVRDTVL